MYKAPPKAEELAIFGFSPEDYSEEVEIWTDFEKAVDLFMFLGTQWRMGANGAIGLDYNVVYHKLDRMKLSDDDYAQMEADIQVLETAALAELRAKD